MEDIGQVARDALMLQQHARPQIHFTAEIPEGGMLAPCDRRLIGQALTNLLQNAADAIASRPGAGNITLTVEPVGDSIHISVADDGIGLPQAERNQLTEPYVTTKEKGTGLGLAIVKKVMEDHDGKLILEDREPGPGAVAILVLPARARTEPAELIMARDDGR
jgi:two-component system nitrogen regulation sensor histidine kinase NtrY